MHRSLLACRFQLVLALLGGGLLQGPTEAADAPLTTLDYRVLGVQLQVTPAAVSVPKNISGSVLVQIADASGNTNVAPELAQGAYVEAIFRGPSFPARKLVARPNQALVLPPLNLVGDYQLDAIRLVDAVTGVVRLEGTPQSVPVHVFDEVLISRVTSRPLSLDEIQERGIVIDQENFRAVEFEVGFVLDGEKIPVKFPVVAPQFAHKAEIIPAAEMQARLVEAQRINDLIASDFVAGAKMPPQLQTPGLNLQIRGVNFEKAGDGDGSSLALTIPPIPALMVIPGNIGYLNQFFSVQIFTENGAPLGSGLSVHNVMAKLQLPPGADQILSRDYSHPGDDPLRFARVGPNGEIHDQLPIVGPPPVQATRLQPGDSGSAEFLVEGLQEGLHVMDLDLTADLDGLAAGTVKIAGKAAGSVLVRNPKFSMAFTHPKTVSFGEPYTASVTLLNTGDTDANLVSVTLRQASISGGKLEGPETVQLGNLAPGQSATANYRVRAQRTGRIRFSNLTTSEASVQGRFNLVMGIDERGVALSPDALEMPDYANDLPETLVDAARRVLGQGLSVATAGRLPAGVQPLSYWILVTRTLELAEAGQRVRYGEPLERVLPDLALDWQGARAFDPGFDQIVRETDAGSEWREALMAAIETADNADAVTRLAERASDLAGRGEAWILSGSSAVGLELEFREGDLAVGLDRSALAQSAGYRGANGNWLAAKATHGLARWVATTDVVSAEVALLTLTTNGTGQLMRWSLSDLGAGACLSHDLAEGGTDLLLDADCDGEPESILGGTVTAVAELPPELLTVFQETTVKFLRPWPSCYGGSAKNYGNLLAVLFSKPMTQTDLNVPQAYLLDSGTPGASVQIQQGNRVALVAMREPVSAILPRTLTVNGVTDVRGNPVVPTPHPIQTDFREGMAARGRVLRADGSPAVGVPVTLTMYDLLRSGLDLCTPMISRTAQKFTDEQGFFDLDFIYGAVPFTVAAVDTAGIPFELATNILQSFDADRFKSEQFLVSLVSSNLAALGNRTAAEAVALAEGLDRAVWRDQIDLNGGRAGGTQIIGLRFRGRGTVTGTVLAADGTSPAPDAAVNLFPDADSREQGRGLFSDANGRFQFNGVPLGRFTVSVQTSRGHYRTVVDTLDQPGDVKDIAVVLTAPTLEEIVRTTVEGRVTEADQATPAAGAQVFLSFGRAVVAALTTDEAGYWMAEDMPVGFYGIQAVSRDGLRGGQASITALAGDRVFASVVLQGVGRVVGRVETSAGLPVPDAVVAGGRAIVRTDANGLFVLDELALGPRSISAGWEADKAPGGFPRLGSASVNVLPGIDNYVVVRLKPAGQIIGQVRGPTGAVVPKVKVAIPLPPDGFAWVEADEQGQFKFINMGLGKRYTVSAPAPPVAEDEARELLADAGVDLGTDDSDDLILATVAAVLTYSQRLDPSLRPEAAPLDGFGWTDAELHFDGETVVANLSLLPSGKVSGVVLNDQGVPIGARVRLTGVLRAPNGEPKFDIVGNRDSDAATGEFTLHGLLAGDWGVQVASPFYPVVLADSGRTTKESLDVTNLVMQFPPIDEVNGRLTGMVVMPDGTPTGEGVHVQISFGPDYVIQTDTNGFFDTQIKIPASVYRVEARDPLSGLRGQVNAQVKAGQTNFVTVPLLGQGSARVWVLDALGARVPGAQVQLRKLGYPSDEFAGPTDAEGGFAVDGIFEGGYAVYAAFNAGAVKLEARGGLTVNREETGSLTLQLGGTGTLRGVFVTRDTGTPIAFARVNVGTVASVPTDAEGRFEVTGLGLTTYRVVGVDSVTGRMGLTTASLNYAGQVVNLTLVELPQGEISGVVFKSGQVSPVAGASVTLNEGNGLNPQRVVTTGPDGAFRFPGVLPGDFHVSAHLGFRGVQITGRFPDVPTHLVVNLTVPADPPTGTVSVQVWEPDGVSPATNATVSIRTAGREGLVDFAGHVTFGQMPLGRNSATARSLAPGQTSSVGVSEPYELTEGSTNASVTVRLSGVGALQGRVFQSDGITPAPGVEVSVGYSGGLASFEGRTALADGSGDFAFSDAPLADYTLRARSVALAGTASGTLTTAGQTDTVNLVLGASGSVIGRLVRADGVTVVPDNEVTITFKSQSGLDGLLLEVTDTDGGFRFDGVPVGPAFVQASLLAYGGVIFTNITLTSNGEELDLGDLRLDEDWPAVVGVTPGPNAAGVAILAPVDLYFSEPIRAGSFDAGGVYLAGPTNNVPATVQLLEDPDGQPTRIRLTPNAPLRSQTTYRVIVVDGNRRNAVGTIIGKGPTDRVDRPLVAPFTSSFTTRDDDPPQWISIFPTNGQVQIDPRAVLRLSFNEPIRTTNFTFTVTGPTGPVPGSANVGFNGLALVFTPSNALPVNASFTLTVNGVADLAGNALPAQPVVSSFATLDTTGPAVTTLRLANGAPPVAGSAVQLEAILANAESGVSVRFTADLHPIGTVSSPPFLLPVTLPTNGMVIYRAIATDAYGNDGEMKDLRVDVVPNNPPVVTLSAVVPTDGEVGSGQPVSLQLTASDDTGVTNVTVVASGGMLGSRTFTNAITTNVTFVVPASALAGTNILFRAQALDTLGTLSAEASVVLAVRDATPPALTLLSPTNNARIDPRQPLSVTVQTSDNSRSLTLEAVLSGAVASTQTVLVPLSPGVSATVPVSLPLPDAPLNGGAVTLSVTVTDTADNTLALTRTLQLQDLQSPQLLSVTPTNAAAQVSLWLASVRLGFDERIDRATVTPDTFRVFDPSGTPLGLTFGFGNGDRDVSGNLPTAPLRPGETYTNWIGAGLSDTGGNTWVFTNGAAPPAEGAIHTFTTARFLTVEPAAGAPVQGGTSVVARVTYEPGLGASVFRFTLGNRAPITVGTVLTSTQVVATLPIELDPDPESLTLRIEADNHSGFIHPWRLADVPLTFAGNATTNQRPVVALTRTAPVEGPLASGMQFSLRLSATDDYAVTNLSLSGSGLINTNAVYSSGGAHDFAFKVPTNAAGGSQAFAAWAVDDLGATSVVATLNLSLLPAVTNIATNEIVYSRFGQPDGAIYVIAADGSNERQITVGEYPRLSPDGRYLAFKRDGQLSGGSTYLYRANLYVRDLWMGDERLVHASFDHIVAYGWRPDGSALVYDYGYSLYQVNPDGSGKVTLFSGNGYDDAPSANPIDGRLTFHNDRPGLGLLVSEPSPALANIVKVPGTAPGDAYPVWSPDGEWIAFLRAGDNFNLWKIRPDGSGLLRLTALAGTNVVRGSGAWSGDGSQLLVPADVQGTNGLFLVNADGSGTELLQVNSGGADYDFVGSVRTGFQPGVPVRLAAGDPPDGTRHLSLWPQTNVVRFTRSILPSTVAGRLLFANNAGLTVSWTNVVDGTRLWIQPELPLAPGVTYTNRILPGLTDRAGQEALLADGGVWPTEGVGIRFTTAAITGVTPASGSVFEAGAFLRATVQFEAGLGADFFRFVVGSGVPQDVAVGPADTEAFAELALPFVGTSTTLQITAHRAGRTPYALAPITLNLTPALGAPIVFSVPDAIALVEGETSNVVFQVNSAAGPLAFIDFDPDLPGPAFIGLSNLVFNLVGTNGVAEGTLIAHPGAVDAGSYIVGLRAATVDGLVVTTNLWVDVFDNPALSATRWKNPINGNWSTATNWTAGVPNATTEAVIDLPGDYTVTVSNNQTVGNVTVGGAGGIQTLAFSGGTLTIDGLAQMRTNAVFLMSGGTLGGPGELWVRGRMDWNGGTMGAGGRTVVAPGAVLRVLGGADHWQWRRVDNQGTIEWPGGGRWLLSGATLHNGPGGVLNWGGSGDFVFYTGSVSLLNEGDVFKTGSGTNTLGIHLNNQSRFAVQQGEVIFSGGGSNAASMHVASGASAVFNSQWTLETNSTLSSVDSGSVRFTANTITVNTPLQLAGRVPIQACTVNCNTDQTFADLSLVTATLGGDGTVTVTNQFDWTSGTLGAGGSLVIPPGATMRLLGNGDRWQWRLLDNQGTIEWPDGGRWFLGSAMLRNRPGGVLNWGGSGDFVYYTGSVSFLNEGEVFKTGSTTNTLGVYFNNEGTCHIDAGRLLANGQGHNNGTISVAPGAQLDLRANFTYTEASVLEAAGALVFSGGNHDVLGALNPTGPLLIQGGIVTVHTPLALDSLPVSGGTVNFHADLVIGTLDLTGGTLGGSGTVTVGTLNWTGGSMSGGGLTVLTDGGNAWLTGTAARYLYRNLDNRGTFTWQDGGTLYLNNARLHNAPGATLNLNANGNLVNAGGAVVVTNAGTILQVAGVTNTVGVPLDNTGSILVQAGQLKFGGGGVQDGILQVDSGAGLVLQASMTHTTNSVLSGQGSIRFTGGTHDLKGVFDPHGPVVFQGGAVTVNNAILPGSLLEVPNNATVNFTTPQTFGTLDLTGGTLGGSGTVTVGTLNWTGGSMSGGGLTVLTDGGNGWLTGTAARYLYRNLDNRGTFTWQDGGTLYFSNARLDNAPGATLNLNANGNLVNAGGAVVVTNAGTILQVAGVTNTVGVPVDNTGSILVQGGQLTLGGGGVQDGILQVDSGAGLVLQASMTHTTNSALGGQGTIRFTGGNHDLKGVFDPHGPVVFQGGAVTVNNAILPGGLLQVTNNATVNFTTPQTFGAVWLSGTVGGGGDVTVTNVFQWSSGTLQGAGRLVMPATTEGWLTNSTSARYLYRPLDNAGVLHWSTGALYLNTATLLNQPGGLWEIGAAGNVVNAGGAVNITNRGTIVRSGGGTNSIQVRLVNEGALAIQSGRLNLSGGGVQRGSVSIDSGATLGLNGSAQGIESGVSFAGTGDLRIQAPLQLATDVDFGALNVTFDGSASLSGAFLLRSGSAGSMTVAKNLTVPGDLTIGGTLQVDTGFTLTVSGTLTLENGSVVNNNGNLTVHNLVDQGATLNGNPVQVIGASPLAIQSITWVAGGSSANPAGLARLSVGTQPTEVVVRFWAPAEGGWTLESSVDLRGWNAAEAQITPVTPGRWEARVPGRPVGATFLRLRRTWAAP